MNCRSDYNLFAGEGCRKAFTITEVIAAMMLLAIIAATLVTVINRSMLSTMDAELKAEAFNLARENMEMLLAADSIEETVEYSESEKIVGVECETIVEPFFEPLTSRMWISAVCKSSYTDSNDQPQQIELTNWITSVPKKMMLEILEQQQLEAESDKRVDEFDETDSEQLDEDIPDESNESDYSNDEVIPGYSMEDLENMDVGQLQQIISEMLKSK